MARLRLAYVEASACGKLDRVAYLALSSSDGTRSTVDPKRYIKPLIPRAINEWRRRRWIRADLLKVSKPLHPRTCPICDFRGLFEHFGRPPRIDARCPSCGSLERHRLFWLWFGADTRKLPEPVLHFAPEKVLMERLRPIYRDYRTADLFDSADLKLDIECIDLPTGSVRTVICNHVLEHVSDKKALEEIYRILSGDGQLVASVPIIEGWERTYEVDNIIAPGERELHFGQFDHVRYYGRDFRDRLRRAGFGRIAEVTAEGQAVVDFSLLRGEKLFICHKS